MWCRRCSLYISAFFNSWNHRFILTRAFEWGDLKLIRDWVDLIEEMKRHLRSQQCNVILISGVHSRVSNVIGILFICHYELISLIWCEFAISLSLSLLMVLFVDGRRFCDFTLLGAVLSRVGLFCFVIRHVKFPEHFSRNFCCFLLLEGAWFEYSSAT